jgi:hypothetical protein
MDERRPELCYSIASSEDGLRGGQCAWFTLEIEGQRCGSRDVA